MEQFPDTPRRAPDMERRKAYYRDRAIVGKIMREDNEAHAMAAEKLSDTQLRRRLRHIVGEVYIEAQAGRSLELARLAVEARALANEQSVREAQLSLDLFPEARPDNDRDLLAMDLGDI